MIPIEFPDELVHQPFYVDRRANGSGELIPSFPCDMWEPSLDINGLGNTFLHMTAKGYTPYEFLEICRMYGEIMFRLDTTLFELFNHNHI